MPECRDHVRRARKRADPALLREAEALAVTGDDWAGIAEAWIDLGDEAAARRGIAAALAKPHDAGTFFHVALLLHRELGDTPAAYEALERCAGHLDATPSSGWDWARLAGSYLRIPGDRAKARSSYECGAARARSRYDLFPLARGYVEELGDRDAALALVQRAEAEADADVTEIAEAYLALTGGADHARRIVDAALATVSDARAALRIVRFAPRSGRDDAPALERAAFAAAEAAAKTAEDWLDIAEHHYDRTPRALDGVRRSLERAAAVEGGGTARQRIIDAYRHWLQDDAAAAKIGPPGLAPHDLVHVRQRLDGWVSDPGRLLHWVRPQLGAASLERLAASAGFAFEKHLAVIADIQRTGLIPYPLGWYPREALEIERWKTGADVDLLRCVFACAVLLVDTAGPEYRDGFEATIAVLVDACRELGTEALDGAIGLLVALAEAFEPELPRFAFALFGLLLAATARDPMDERLPALADRLLVVVAGYQQRFTSYTPEWLLGLTNFDSRHALFRALVRAELSAPHLAAIAHAMQVMTAADQGTH